MAKKKRVRKKRRLAHKQQLARRRLQRRRKRLREMEAVRTYIEDTAIKRVIGLLKQAAEKKTRPNERATLIRKAKRHAYQYGIIFCFDVNSV